MGHVIFFLQANCATHIFKDFKIMLTWFQWLKSSSENTNTFYISKLFFEIESEQWVVNCMLFWKIKSADLNLTEDDLCLISVLYIYNILCVRYEWEYMNSISNPIVLTHFYIPKLLQIGYWGYWFFTIVAQSLTH